MLRLNGVSMFWLSSSFVLRIGFVGSMLRLGGGSMLRVGYIGSMLRLVHEASEGSMLRRTDFACDRKKTMGED